MNDITINNPASQTVTLSGPDSNLSMQVPPALNVQTVAGAQGPQPTVPLLWGNISGDILNQLDLQQEFAVQAGIAQTNLVAHTSNLSNPHQVTKAQIGLDQVQDYSPDNLPLSIATAAAIAAVVAGLPSFPIPVAQGGTGAVNAANARTNLGATSLGNTLFTVSSGTVALNALGAGPTGSAVFQSSTQAAGRGALGSTTIGDALFTAANAAAAQSAINAAPVPVAQGGTGDSGTLWSTQTVTPTSGTGALTTASAVWRFKTIGKTAFFSCNCTITNNGTGTGSIVIPLPTGWVPKSTSAFGGQCTSITGKTFSARMAAAGSTTVCLLYDATYPASTGEVLTFSGVVELT